MPFWFGRLARRDLFAIIEYYTAQSENVAERFVDEVVAALKTLCSLPGIGSPRHAHLLEDRSLRAWRIDYFPFNLFYRTADEQLAVLRILHERRDFTSAHFDGVLA